MFEHLDDPQPLDGVGRRDAVAAAAGARRRTRRLLVAGGAASVCAVLLVTFVFVAPGHHNTARLVTAPPSPTPSSPAEALPTPSASPSPTAVRTPTPQPSPRAVSQAVAADEPNPSSSPTPSPVPSSAPRPECPSQAGDSVPQGNTRADFYAQIEHAWLVCSDPTVFGTHEDGIEFRNDGTWSKLAYQGDGTFRRLTGSDNTGTWVVLDLSAMNGGDWQLDFHVGDGTLTTHPDFADGAQRVQLNNESVYESDYVQLAANRVTGPPSTWSPRIEPASCTADEGGRAPVAGTQADFEQQMAQVWQLCEKPSEFGTDEDGLEVRSDHTWWKLVADGNGQYHRLTGATDHGTWTAEEETSGPQANWFWWWKFTFSDDSFSGQSSTAFANNVPIVEMSDGHYVPLPDDAVVG